MTNEIVSEPDDQIQETQFSTSTAQLNESTPPTQTVTSHGNQNYGTTPTPTSTKPQSPTKPARALAPDLLRGLLMILQAIDHAAVTSGAWAHGTAIVSEGDGQPVTKWNRPVAWTCRMLTHLCAPGFMFLLGMGVVYFGRSRRKLGWSGWRMTRHFFVRAVVLALVNQIIGMLILGGKLMIINIVLLALAVDYFLAGVVWLGVEWTEGKLAGVIEPLLSGDGQGDDDDDAAGRLLDAGSYSMEGSSRRDTSTTKTKASSISSHVHNLLLLVLSGITIWWNVWLSANHGHCLPDLTTSPPNQQQPPPQTTAENPWFAFFFHVYRSPRVLSAFPPLAWISFPLLGQLYARLILSSTRRSPRQISLINFLIGLTFAALFVTTRLFHFGNLSEGCLRMAEQAGHTNQYTAGFRAFFYVTKYPPSPSFAFFTMSIIFLFLSAFGFVPAGAATRVPFSVLLTYGTCALFFYAVHLPLYVVLGMGAQMIWGREMDWEDALKGKKAVGVPLGVFWVDWAVGLVLMWGLCRWYGGFKASKGPDSIWRFF